MMTAPMSRHITSRASENQIVIRTLNLLFFIVLLCPLPHASHSQVPGPYESASSDLPTRFFASDNSYKHQPHWQFRQSRTPIHDSGSSPGSVSDFCSPADTPAVCIPFR